MKRTIICAAVGFLISIMLVAETNAQGSQWTTNPPRDFPVIPNMKQVTAKIKERCEAEQLKTHNGKQYKVCRAHYLTKDFTPFDLEFYEDAPADYFVLIVEDLEIGFERTGRLLWVENKTTNKVEPLHTSPNPAVFEPAYALADDCIGQFINNRAAIVAKLREAMQPKDEIRRITPEEAEQKSRNKVILVGEIVCLFILCLGLVYLFRIKRPW